MKNFKRCIATFLVVLTLITSAPLSGLIDFDWSAFKVNFPSLNLNIDWDKLNPFATEAEAYTPTYNNWDTFEFGMYPKSKETDSAVISKLNAKKADSDGYYTLNDGTRYAAYGSSYYRFEPITWRVVYSYSDDSILIMTDQAIDCRQFSSNSTDTWANSSIRSWLNKEFYNAAFSSSEKQNIITSYVDNSETANGITPTADTKDKIILFSHDELTNTSYGFKSDDQYDDTHRRTTSTAYAQAKGSLYHASSGYVSYWTRSHKNSKTVYVLSSDGCVGDCHYPVYATESYSVRPICRVRFSKLEFSTIKYDTYVASEKDRNDNYLYIYYKPGDASKSFNPNDIALKVKDSSIAACSIADYTKSASGSYKIKVNVEPKSNGTTTLTASYGSYNENCKLYVTNPLEITASYYGLNDNASFYVYNSNFVAENNLTDQSYNLPIFSNLELKLKDDATSLKSEWLDYLCLKDIELSYKVDGDSLSLKMDGEKQSAKIEKTIDCWYYDLYNKENNLKELNLEICSDEYSLPKKEKIKCSFEFNAKYSSEFLLNSNSKEKSEFSILPYKYNYINKHIKAITDDNGFFSRCNIIINEFSDYDKSFQYNWVNFIESNLISSIIDAIGDFTETKGYEIILADIISTSYDENAVSSNISQITGQKELEFISSITDYIAEVINFDIAKDISLKKSKLILSSDVSNALKKPSSNPELYKTITQTIDNSKLQKITEKFLKIDSNMSKALTGIGIAINTIEGLFEAIKVVSSYNAYLQLSVWQKQAILNWKVNVNSNDNPGLYNALDKYYNLSTDISFSDYLSKFVKYSATNNMDDIVGFAVSAVSDGVLKLISNVMSKGVLTNLAKAGAGAVSHANAFLAGITLGKAVSKLICNTGSFSEESNNIVWCCKMAESLKKAINNSKTTMKSKDTSLSSAYCQALIADYELSLYKKISLKAHDYVANALNAQGNAWINKLFKNTKKFKDAAESILSCKTYLIKLNCHNIDFEKFFMQFACEINTATKETNTDNFKIASVHCPVDVYVYNSEKQLVCSIIDNKLISVTDEIDVLIVEDEKYIVIPSTGNYSIKVDSFDDGEMDYYVNEYSLDSFDGNPIRTVSYEDVDLYEGQIFEGTIPTDIYVDCDEYNLLTDDDEIYSTEDSYVELDDFDITGDDEMPTDSELQLEIDYDPYDASYTPMTWSSSDEKIATVDNKGLVRSHSEGKVTITCETDDMYDTFTIDVYQCEHSFGKWTKVTDSTCFSYGYSVRSCTECLYNEYKYDTSLSEHTPSGVSYTVDATCTEDSYTATFCENCSSIIKSNFVSGTKLGHDFQNFVSDNNATCSTDGTKTGKCTRCGETDTITDTGSKTGKHSYSLSEWVWTGVTNATAKFTCNNCSKTVSANSTITSAVTMKPTCSVAGEKTYTAKAEYNGVTYTTFKLVEEPMIAHNYSTKWTVDTPADTYSTGAKSHHCTMCRSKKDTTSIPRIYSWELSNTEYFADGTAKSPGVTVKDYNGKTLVKNTDYTVTYSSATRKDAGSYYVTITFKGNYTGSKTLYYYIRSTVTNVRKDESSLTGIKLSWNKLAGVTAYNVYRKLTTDAAYKKIGTTKSLTYTDSKVSVNKEYYYVIRPYNSAKEGTDSSSIYLNTKISTPSSFSVYPDATGTIRIYTSLGSNTTGYELYRATSEDGKYSQIKSSAYYYYYDTGLKVGTTYYYKARCFNMVNGKKYYSDYTSARSATASVETPASPIVYIAGETSLYVTWKPVNGVTGYDVYRCDSSYGSYVRIGTTKNTNYLDKSLQPDSRYYYKIVAYKTISKNNNIYSNMSGYDYYTTKFTAPYCVEVKSSSMTTNVVSWKIPSGAKGVELSISVGNSYDYKVIGEYTTTSYTHKNLDSSTWYYYRLRSYKIVSGSKVYSDYTTLSHKATLPQVTGLKASNTSKNSTKLTWNKVSNATIYYVYYSSSLNGSYYQLGTSETNSFEAKDLTIDNRYYFKVEARRMINGYTNNGVYSEPVCKIIAVPATSISSISNASSTSLKISWKKINDATSYTLYRSTSKDSGYSAIKSGITSTSYVDTKLSTNKTYYYKVKSVYSSDGGVVNNSGYSAVVSKKVVLTAPAISVENVSLSKLKISWIKDTYATGYEVYRSTSSNGTYTKIATISKAATESYTDSKVSTGKTYYYKLRAYKTASGKTTYSGYSKVVSAKVVLSQVTGLVSTPTTSKIKLSWKAVTDAKYYKVESSSDGKNWKTYATVSTNSVTAGSYSPGSTNYFRVTALDSAKKIAGKTSAVLKTGTLISAPTIKLTSTKSKTATVTITKVTGAAKYVIWKSTDGSKWTKVTTTTSTTYTLTGLTAEKKIYVKVQAENAYGKVSAYSKVASVTVKN